MIAKIWLKQEESNLFQTPFNKDLYTTGSDIRVLWTRDFRFTTKELHLSTSWEASAGLGKLVFFRHQGRKWRNIPMVNVTCLKTTIWNFIEILVKSAATEAAARVCASHYATNNSLKTQKSTDNSIFKALFFIPFIFFQPSLCGYHVMCLYGRGKHEPWFVKVDFDHYRHSQWPPVLHAQLTVYMGSEAFIKSINL